MKDQPFTPHQLFNLKKKTLEKRIPAYFQASDDSDATIQYLVALQVRDRMGDSEFHLVLPDLVHRLFMTRKVTKIMKKFLIQFKDYFPAKEWRYLTLRIFPIRQIVEKVLVAVDKSLNSIQPFRQNQPLIE